MQQLNAIVLVQYHQELICCFQETIGLNYLIQRSEVNVVQQGNAMPH